MMIPLNLRRMVMCIGMVGGMSASMSALAGLTPLDDQALSNVEGQATGVQLALTMMINQSSPGVETASCASTASASYTFCRLGLQINNVANWLLFKSFNGYINIPNLVLFGTTVNPGSGVQSAVAFSVTLPTPQNANGTAIQFKNFAYTLGIGINPCYTDGLGNCPANAKLNPNAAENQATYYQQALYQNTAPAGANYSANAYDTGKETGILGVQIHGNLYVGGQLNVFSK